MLNNFLLAFSGLCAIAAACVVVLVLISANGAPQEASGIAFALAIAIIPYCFARARSEREQLARQARMEKRQEEILEALKTPHAGRPNQVATRLPPIFGDLRAD